MPLIGMDIDTVRQLATQMDTDAQQIQQIMQALTSELDSAPWIGPDRERFHNEWHSTHVAQLTAVVHSPQEASQAARRNADEQDQASR